MPPSTLGADIDFLTPDGFPSVPVPTYQGLRVALPNGGEIAQRIENVAPEAIHIATEGPIGWSVARLLPPPRSCLHHVLYDAIS